MLQYQATTLLSLIPKATFLADFQTILMNLITLSLSSWVVGSATTRAGVASSLQNSGCVPAAQVVAGAAPHKMVMVAVVP